jgi:hypothetical protein
MMLRMTRVSAGAGRFLSLGFCSRRLGFSITLTRALPDSRPFVQDQGVELNELDWDEMLKFGGIALLALIVLARLMMRG